MPATNTQTLELLLEVGRLLSSKLELSELLTAVLNLSVRVVDAQRASLLLLDEKTSELYFHVALGLDPGVAKIRLPLGSGIAGSVAKNRTSEIIPVARLDPRWSSAMDAHSGFLTRSILAVPILIKGHLLGVLEAINKRDGNFSDADMRALEAFASQAAVAIENARLFASLEEERFKLATMFAQMTDGAALTDSSGKVLLSNEAAAQLLGTELRDISAGFQGMSVTPPIKDLLAGDPPLLDFTALRKEPTLLALEGRVTKAPLGESDGRLFMFHNHTDSFREETLKRTFLSLISHKLRTPLTAVTGFADILINELNADTTAMMAKAAGTIQAQGYKLSELVDKLLRFVMIESPDIKINYQPFSLDEAVKEVLTALKDKFDRRGAKVNAPATRLFILGDKKFVTEALKELLDNGIKFNPERSPVATLSARAVGDWAAVTVSDTGPGVPPEDIKRVFSSFYQVEKYFTGHTDGLGLGLCFVRKVAELHGGAAVLQSKFGVGSSITLTLPLKRNE